MAKTKIRRGVTVEVIAGDDKGKSGKVLMVNIEQGRVLVEGVNFVKKHMQKVRTIRRAVWLNERRPWRSRT